MVQPEDRIKAGIRNDAHMATVSNQTVDSIMHVLKTVVSLAPAVCVSSIRERCIARLIGDQLIRHGVEAAWLSRSGTGSQ